MRKLRKKFLVILVALAAVLGNFINLSNSVGTAEAATSSKNNVTFYVQDPSIGTKFTDSYSRNNFGSSPGGSNLNNTISSLTVGKNTKVTLYDGENFSGASYIVTNASNADKFFDLTQSFNDKTSSYKIEDIGSNSVTFYENGKNTGAEYTESVSRSSVNNSPGGWKFNKNISGVTLAARTELRIYDGENYTGSTYYLSNNTDQDVFYNLSTIANGVYNDKTSSYIVYHLDGYNAYPVYFNAVFYDELNGNGQSFRDTVRGTNLSRQFMSSSPGGDEFNDRASSVKLTPGTKLTVFEEANYGGASSVYTNTTNVDQLINLTSFDNKMSSYIIELGTTTPTSHSVTFYENPSGSGQSYIDTMSRNWVGDSPGGSYFDDKISSVALEPHTRLVIYEDSNKSGYRHTVINDSDYVKTYDLTTFDNRISSYEIDQLPAHSVTFLQHSYENAGNSGYNYTETISRPSFDNSPIGSSFNDMASSVIVGAYTKVLLYQNANYGGETKELNNDTNGEKVFNLSDFNDKASSFTISKTR
ncbi:hypothetical protein [Bacillus sp. JKS001846]|uniref:hypothetical protein n=1 Tax=Bacillus sp. JKS001846 TaxID=1938743 RepID=UPI0009D7CF90|nr:hypothetical protein [Bacillus sp. JKS001846]SMD41303.1 hypothetical protein SAMN06272738_6023 [Bacillus sp. JKS001846]